VSPGGGLKGSGKDRCVKQYTCIATTANCKLVFGIFAALAEFERELIRERTPAGLALARPGAVMASAPSP
jgi:DNA invertase Pin-like site-specific DNA recombinase